MGELGIPAIVECKEGLFEGGDFAFLNENTIALGMVERTNEKEFEELKIDIIPVEEQAIFEHGCNLQALGNRKVISLKRNTYVNEELRKRGMEVIELDITEILKAGGGSHCMTFPLIRE